MGLGSVQVQTYILQEVVRAHGDGYDQTMYKWSVRTVTENNKGKRTIGLPREDNRMSVQGRSQNRVGFDGNPLGSDAKPEAMPEGGVEPE